MEDQVRISKNISVDLFCADENHAEKGYELGRWYFCVFFDEGGEWDDEGPYDTRDEALGVARAEWGDLEVG